MKDELELDMEWKHSATHPRMHDVTWSWPHVFFIATLSDSWIGLQCKCGYNWSLRRDNNAILYLQNFARVLESERPYEHFRLRLVSETELPNVVGE